MKTVLRTLIIEDSEDDALLLLHHVEKAGYDIEYERVETAETMKAALGEKAWDIVLSDYNMPRFNGLEALLLLQESGIDIPFIVISGTIGEDIAVETMKAGAQDYIMKNNLRRLLPAIERELRESKIRAERKLLEQKQIQAEQERLANLHYFESMDRVNRAIQGTNDLEQMMSNVLDTVLSIFDCDRACLVYPCDPEAASWRAPIERTKPGYPGVLVQGFEFPMDPEVRSMYRTVLASSGPVQFGPNSEQPLPAQVVKQFNEQSQIAMAIHPKRDKPYMFALHQCSYPRIWTSEEEKLLQEIGRRLTDVLTSLLAYRNLLESEAKYRRIVETASEGIWMLGPDSMTTFVNARMAEMFGYSGQEMIGRPATDFMIEEDVPDHLRKMENRRQGLPENYEWRFRRKDGEAVWTLASATPIFDEEHHFQGSFGMFTDITERKQAEEELRRLKDELEQRVKERTAELEEKNAQLERMNRLFVGRELRMVELKEKIRKLEEKPA